MKKYPIPYLTLLLFLISSDLMLLPDELKSLLYFDRQAIDAGQLWSLVSGHFMHSDFQHWLWNSLALVVLGSIIERHSKRLLIISLLLGIIAVDVLLLSPLCKLDLYCGLSGVLNSLLMVALWLAWRASRSAWVISSAVLCIGKNFIEMAQQQSLLTQISWPPYPAAHLAGAIGGALVIALFLISLKQTVLPLPQGDDQ